MSLLRVRSRRGAYGMLVALAFVWGANWIVMKLALAHAHPIVFNAERTGLAIVALFVVMAARGASLRPPPWRALVITALLQTTLNMGSTTMALAGGGAGRTSVLVFTMPFWTQLLAWPFLHERVRGAQWGAIALAVAGLVLIVEPWRWSGDLAPKVWAVLSGLGWAGGTVAMKYFQRDGKIDMLSFMAWQMAIGAIPFLIVPMVVDFPVTQWSFTQVLLLCYVSLVATAVGFIAWIEILRWLPAGTASLNMFVVPVIALLLSMALFGESLTTSEWAGIACIGAGLAALALQARRNVPRALDATLPVEGG
jgi:drug/metabolite transporter (DMT)-like permease